MVAQVFQQLLAVLAFAAAVRSARAAVQVVLAQDDVEGTAPQRLDRAGGVHGRVDARDAGLPEHVLQVGAHARVRVDDQHAQLAARLTARRGARRVAGRAGWAVLWHACPGGVGPVAAVFPYCFGTTIPFRLRLGNFSAGVRPRRQTARGRRGIIPAFFHPQPRCINRLSSHVDSAGFQRPLCLP